ncbi:MAG: hypothetical protein ABSB15_22555 [Bryobacteraceae bacterium]|jgi:hypothetical protein
MSFNKELRDQRRLEKDRKNLEKVSRLLSDRQQRANQINALKSTGPRTEEGKQKVRLNGLRHGLTGQVSVMTDDNRREHDEFCNPILARLSPDGPLELQLANLIAHDHWRLNRVHSIEDGIFALGHGYPQNQIDSGAPQADVAFSEAVTFMRSSKEILLLTTYESRINRNIKRNMEQLNQLQTERQAHLKKDREEAQLLHQLAESKSQAFDPAQNGFAFSSLELNFLVERNRQLKEAKALAEPPRTFKKAA